MARYLIRAVEKLMPYGDAEVLLPLEDIMEAEAANASSSEGRLIAAESDIDTNAANIDLLEAGGRLAAAVTANADGTTTAIIASTTGFATVTSGNAAHKVTLPAPVVGKVLIITVGANGFELQSSAPATIAINAGAGSGFSSTIAANSTIIAICLSATAWKAFFLDADSDLAKVEAAHGA